MRVPLSWLREYAPGVSAPAAGVADALVRAGLEVETVHAVGDDITGVVVGEVLAIERVEGVKKPITYCQVETGSGVRGIVCGATNVAVGDRVPVALPGAVLPGDFVITARETYGHVSDGMMCSARELGLGDDHSGILVLEKGAELGRDVVELLGLRDDVLDIAVTPDRGYCLSVRGVAREAAIAFGVDFLDHAVREGEGSGTGGYPVQVEDPAGCPRYIARVVRGVDAAAQSPLWLRRRVTLGGMRPISVAVDVTNYLLLSVGQPLHAFDMAVLRGGIVVRRARAGERIVTLDGVDRALRTEDLVIADDSGPVGIAGVMGGSTAEVGPGTHDLVIEAAYFDPGAIARTARAHQLSSEASRRFERGIDPELAPATAQLAVEMLRDVGGGTADVGVTEVGAAPTRPHIALTTASVGAKAGRAYADDVVRRRLVDVGCAVTGVDELDVQPPSWRPDLTQDVDLIEEVVRLEGYDSLPSVLPTAPAGRGLTAQQRARRRLGRALGAAGYVETVCYPFVAVAALDALGIGDDDERRALGILANPVNDAEPGLRTTLLPGLLAALGRNLSRGNPDVALFESGLVFLARGDRTSAPRLSASARPSAAQLALLDSALPAQPWHLAVAMAGGRAPAGWWGRGRTVAWPDPIEAARLAAKAVGARLTVQSAARAPWHPGRCAALLVDGAVVGHAGELHPRVVAALELPERTSAMELDLEPLFVAATEVVQAPDVSAYPPAAVDVALVVAATTPVADLADALRDGAGPLLEELRLFDVYVGEQLPPGTKSLAYTLRFRAVDRTLTDEEVNALRDEAVAEAARQVGATLRS